MGELPKYYVHECHPAIIDRDTFQRVQEEPARRSSLRKTSTKTKTEPGKYCGKYVLSELLVCGECGKSLPQGGPEPFRGQAGRVALHQSSGAWQEGLQEISHLERGEHTRRRDLRHERAVPRSSTVLQSAV